ncbi:MAG: zf-HC2 domain-containing protein [Nocardioidaceae bacterium]
MTDCARLRELLGGHVLHALDPDEQAELDRHLESCPRCRREHAELAGVPALLDLLDSPAAAESPPPALEEAVLDRFARERRRLRPHRPAAGTRWRLGLAAAAAAAVLVATLALAGVFSSSREGSAYSHARLHGADAAVAKADFRAVGAGTYVRLSASGLPRDRNAVYELWCVTKDGRWLSGGTFRADRRGAARARLTSAARPGEYELMVVTRRAGRHRGPRVLSGAIAY